MEILVNVGYLIASVCFIVAIKCLSSPRRAVVGNLIGAFGMLVAVVAVLRSDALHPPINWTAIGIGLIVGTILGALLARTVRMTAMPQMVALLNGFGGAASALVASAELLNGAAGADMLVPVALSILIGGLTFTGSLIAFAKLQELMSGRPITYPMQKTVNALMLVAAVALSVMLVREPGNMTVFYAICALSLALGVTAVIPIGGADMPVVISLLNSYSGMAACATGFVLRNNALIISGSLVGASGIILTAIMCKAMNRSLANVLFGAFGSAPAEAASTTAGGVYKSVTPDDAAMIFDAAKLVIVVPGYGMAVAQAQHVIREFADQLAARGTTVKYAIHPVAGRMPGHMNVLLAEANVSYDAMVEMDAINPQFAEADVALVIGANDVVNPDARTNKSSPIYGMPILDVDKAGTVIVSKRSMRPGFAGIDNPLFYNPKTSMLFGDAKESVGKLITAMKEL